MRQGLAPLALLLLLQLLAHAAPWPRVESIRFQGNDTTRERVMLREMTVRPGDAADPQALEDSRQALLDLGLFRSVAISTGPADGGVAILVVVEEKWYVLPIPRLDASSDGDVGYGGQLRWNNVFGMNHTFNAYVERADFDEERDREQESSVRVSYLAPYLGGSRWNLQGTLQYLDRAALDPAGRGFDETFRRAELLATRDFTHDRPRRGWILGTGLRYEEQSTEGEFAPPSDGTAIALVGTARYDDLRFHVRSETGRRFDARAEVASDDAGSDYDYSRMTARYFEARAFGSRPHQTLHFLAAGGISNNGPGTRNAFSLGGSGALRGYGSDFLEGDRYYYFATEFLRPVRWDWLRLLVLAEAGGVDRNVHGSDVADGSPYASLGLGVRIRLTRFVDVEVEAGIAVPLRGGGGARFFAGGN